MNTEPRRLVAIAPKEHGVPATDSEKLNLALVLAVKIVAECDFIELNGEFDHSELGIEVFISQKKQEN